MFASEHALTCTHTNWWLFAGNSQQIEAPVAQLHAAAEALAARGAGRQRSLHHAEVERAVRESHLQGADERTLHQGEQL